ncbi:hypothetical protein GGR58DRAFT_69255 [Xylaria digitata]|nr:hypothetical protein GGR58DRAFT_69255 [Xylaria digitata]
MSFGFSVGDILAVSKLVADIISCLNDSKGSQSEYRDLVRELECLQISLVHLDKLPRSEASQVLDSIKYAALSCRRPLEEFLARIRNYDRSLGIQSKLNPVKATIDKIKFPLHHGDEIKKLQAYLSVHIGAINTVLAEYGLERIALAEGKSEKGQLQIKQRLENNASILNRIQSSVSCRGRAIFQSMSTLEKVYKIVSGELEASLKSFESLVVKVCVSTQQIYAVVLEIQTSIAKCPDVRWTFFQDPIIVEDALGRKFPVPSEYDFSLLDAIVKHKFQEGPGAAHVATENYEIMDAKNQLRILSVSSRLRSGGAVTMAILVGRPQSVMLSDECPRCQSSETRIDPSGGRLCCECNMWFDRSTKKFRGFQDLWKAHEILSIEARSSGHTSQEKTREKKWKRTSDDDLSVILFKNVKVTNFEDMHESNTSEFLSRSDPDESDDSSSFADTNSDTTASLGTAKDSLSRPVNGPDFNDVVRFVNKIKVRKNYSSFLSPLT